MTSSHLPLAKEGATACMTWHEFLPHLTWMPLLLSFAQQRHAEHYKKVLSLADDIFTQGKENFLEGLQLFDQEKANILAGQSWAEKNLKVNSSANELCKAYAGVGVHVLDLRLIPKQTIPWLETGLEAARRSKDQCYRRRPPWQPGQCLLRSGRARKAIEYHEQALKISREIGDKRGEGTALGNLGMAYSDLGEPRKAIEYHEQALKISARSETGGVKENAWATWAIAYSDLGEPRKAIEYYEQALKISREIGDRKSEGAAWATWASPTPISASRARLSSTTSRH